MDDASPWGLEYPLLRCGHLLHRCCGAVAMAPLEPAPSKHYWLFFFLFFIFNSALIGLLAYFGVKLIKGDDAAILLTSAVLLAEFMSFVLGTMVFWVGLRKYVPFLDTSADPLAPQILTGYPMIGLIVTLVLAIRNQRGAARL